MPFGNSPLGGSDDVPICKGPDPWAQRLSVIFLGLVGLGSALGTLALASLKEDIPPGLTGIGGMALGALAGMLPTFRSRQ